MKRILYTLVVGAFALGLQAAQPTTGIKGTMHDLSATGYKTVTNVTEICIFCHTPHNAASAQIIPLWNRTTTGSTFTMYGGATALGTTLKGQSLACLSCHDGTVAMGSLLNTPYGVTVSYATGTATSQIDKTTGLMVGTHALGTDLSNDHPINVAYDLVGMQPISSLTANGVELFPTTVVGSTVECASCHDVHNWGGAGITGAPFLRVNNTGSALCLTCHNK